MKRLAWTRTLFRCLKNEKREKSKQDLQVRFATLLVPALISFEIDWGPDNHAGTFNQKLFRISSDGILPHDIKSARLSADLICL